MKRIANRLIIALAERKLTIALAESVTCGLAAHQLSTVKGTSEILKGSIVCYHEEVKINLLGIKPSLIKKYSAESKKVTEEMTRKLMRLIKADVYAGVTGLASAGGSENKRKPVGTIFFCIYFKNKYFHERMIFRGSPLQIRKKACAMLYKLILLKVKSEECTVN
jgi:nicotinamide-nucleotide amidase